MTIDHKQCSAKPCSSETHFFKNIVPNLMPYLKIDIMNYLKDKSAGVIYFSDFKLSNEKAKHVGSAMYLIPQQMIQQ